MNLYRLFPQIGKVIASTGSRTFPRMLHDLISLELAVDATQITELRTGLLDTEELTVSSLGGVGITPSNMDTLVGIHDSIKHFALNGDNPSHDISGKRLNTLINHSLDSTPMQATAPDFSTQLHLTSSKNDSHCVLSVYRSHKSPGFSTEECALLKGFSSLLLPMIEKHIAALLPSAPRRPENHKELGDLKSCGLDVLRQRFIDRLLLSNLNLSSRETEVCVGLLAGRTAPELAEQFGLRVNTIESYLKRAAVKMGIGGRRSLIRWMHSAETYGLPALASA
ncbi:MAG: LuxR C-terminal-related transcriptional regulator [Pseudomonadota bacterium]